MILCKLRSGFLVCLLLLLAGASARPTDLGNSDLDKTILPITVFHWKLKVKPLVTTFTGEPTPRPAPGLGGETDFGTGFCIDRECRLIGTNYHVAVMARPGKIKGNKIVQHYLATGPDDEGATLNDILSERPMKYTLIRDLAIFELQQPLSHYHGISFSLEDLEMDQQVDIFAYPKEKGPAWKSLNLSRMLQRFHGEYKGHTPAGLLTFEYSPSNGQLIRGGASGGLVVDSKTRQIVGILSMAGVGTNGKWAALAVPIQSLADFVGKVKPWMAQSIFPTTRRDNISPTLADLYPKFVRPRSDALEHRSDEPGDIKMLREKAQGLADSMQNFVAVQSFAWGSGKNDVPVAVADYEVKVLGGFQRFREYPDGKEELQDVPFPAVNTVVVSGGEWSELPQMVGKELGLRIHQAPDRVVNERRVKVFQYQADVEDSVPCTFRTVRDLVFYTASKVVTVPCYGEVWTDQDMNIVRISLHLELAGKWKDYHSVVTYGWLPRTDMARRLIPLTISTEAEFKNKFYWCRGVFRNYHVYTSESRIVVGDRARNPN